MPYRIFGPMAPSSGTVYFWLEEEIKQLKSMKKMILNDLIKPIDEKIKKYEEIK